MDRIMDIKQLRYFCAIIDHGSITRASQRLNIAQPALSLHIKKMEEELGVRLLDRGKFGIRPTEAGTLLAQRARSLLDDFSRIEDDIRTLDRDPTGVVRIGLPGTISSIVALPLIEASRQRYPRIKLNIAEAMSGFISDWLTEGRVDLAILYETARHGGTVSELLLEEELVVLWPGNADCPSELDLAELGDIPMILPSTAHGLRIQIDAALDACGIVPNVAMEIDSYANIKRLVAAGFGASILPSHAILEELKTGSLATSRISGDGLWRGAHMVCPSDKSVSRAQEIIRNLLREVVKDLMDRGVWAATRAPRTD
tara:strand:+ start:38235 stop:39176 length:942 start_codon:yes stop_codon:yes gene_type:complete